MEALVVLPLVQDLNTMDSTKGGGESPYAILYTKQASLCLLK